MIRYRAMVAVGLLLSCSALLAQDAPTETGNTDAEKRASADTSKPKESRPKIKLYYDESGQLILEGLPRDIKAFDYIYEELLKEAAPTISGVPTFKVYKPRYIDVTLAASILENVFNGPAKPSAVSRRRPNQPTRQQPQQGNQKEEPQAPEDSAEEEMHRSMMGFGGFSGMGGGDLSSILSAMSGEFQGIQALPEPQRGMLIVVSKQPEVFPAVEDLLSKLDRKAESGQYDYEIVELKRLAAEEVKADLDELFGLDERTQPRIRRVPVARGAQGNAQTVQLAEQLKEEELQLGDEGQSFSKKDIRVTAVAQTNSIIVFAPKEAREKIANAVRDLDAQGPDQWVVPYPLKNADATSLAKALDEAYGGKGKEGPQAVRVTADPESNTLYVTAPDSVRGEIQMEIVRAESQAIEIKPRVLSIAQGDAEQIAKVLKSAYKARGGKDKVEIVGDTAGKRLVVVAPQDIFKEIEQIVGSMDQGVDDISIRTFKLEHASAPDVKVKMDQMVQEAARSIKAQGGSSPDIGAFSVQADAATNQLVVMGNPKTFLLVERVLQDIDREPPAPTRRMTKTFLLGRADATQVAQNINRIFAEQGKSVTVAPKAGADTATNTVIVEGTAKQIEQIEQELIAPLEALAELRTIHTIKLSTADATVAANMLNDLVKQRSRKGQTPPAITASPATNSLVLYASESEMREFQPVLDSLEQNEESAGTTRRIVLEYQNAAQMADLLTQIYTEPAKKERRANDPRTVPLVLAEDGTNSLLVRAQELDYQEILATVKSLDTSEAVAAAGKVQVIRVAEGIDVVELAQTIEQTIKRSEDFEQKVNKNYKPAYVAIEADPRTNTLLVGGSPSQFPEVERIVRALESMKPTGPSSVKVINLRNIDSADVKKVLDQLVEEQNKSKKRR